MHGCSHGVTIDAALALPPTLFVGHGSIDSRDQARVTRFHHALLTGDPRALAALGHALHLAVSEAAHTWSRYEKEVLTDGRTRWVPVD